MVLPALLDQNAPSKEQSDWDLQCSLRQFCPNTVKVHRYVAKFSTILTDKSKF